MLTHISSKNNIYDIIVMEFENRHFRGLTYISYYSLVTSEICAWYRFAFDQNESQT